MNTARARRAAALLLAVAASSGSVAGCSSSSSGSGTSVFHVKAGECFLPPSKVQAELTSLKRVACTSGHTQEAYAVVTYTGSGSGFTDQYPGDTVLKTYADGVCAQRFSSYVGVDYQDSSLFFTYLLPSARGWQQGHDRNVICFVTTTGAVLHKSVKGTKT
ncbi:MAG: septum formation family protein [Frankiaceae bacterium]|nr:septum formation family protein [Frankiaceae bacterium]MBV9368310.1 septum formation family protein [Frankiales bacterium]